MSSVGFVALILAADPAYAYQTVPGAASASASDDIIVTARRREERLIDVPIAITAFSANDISRFGAVDLQAVSAQTPQLIVNQEVGATGGSISLRGVSTGTFGGDFDQAVSLNVDGITISRAATLQQGFFDVERIEVLKGPQSLFFGKNSPGGIISFRTADPGKSFEGLVRAAYNFSKRGAALDTVLSGPLSSNWGARLAFHVNDQKGYYRNVIPGQTYDRVSDERDYFGRFTLKGNITDKLSMRAKIAVGHLRTSGQTSSRQTFLCPTVSAIATGDDCIANHKMLLTDSPDVLTNAISLNRDGKPLTVIKSVLASVELNYDLSNDIELTSVTGYNWYDRYFFVVDNSRDIIPTVSGNQHDYGSFTQEFRVATRFGGPFEMMVGGFYQNVESEVDGSLTLYAPFPTGAFFLAADTKVRTNAYSVFAQASFDILPTLELSGGARYTREEKSSDKDRFVNSLTPTPQWRDLKLNASDLSPEVTLSWKPSPEVNIYAGYREGFKSGGYATTVTAISQPSFSPERVHGFEGGIKAELFGRQLHINAAAYAYDYKDLQVSIYDPVSRSTETSNAAAAKVKGIEADILWRPAELDGFELRGGLGYNEAKYVSFINQCYVGQNIANGCNVNLATGIFRSQDMSGKPLPNAPKWSGTVDVNYSGHISSDLKYGVAVGTSYSGRYQPHDKADPVAVQKEAWRLNASMRLFADDGGWELALIGRNLTDVFRATYVLEVNATGSGTGTAAAAPVGANLIGYYGEPRSVSLQGTVRF